ncbi:MAG: hypothetical protein M3081_16930 [Gemmatimonadota bacterium]|nr:hypothetical protein [Gemmatimonadota bacterium]
MIVLSDLKLLLLIGLSALAAGGLIWLLLRRARVNVADALTSREWRIALKLAAVIVMAIVILLARISLEYPADQFIYGRF